MCPGPVRGPFGPGHARAVGAAVESAAGLYAMADHLQTAVLANGDECVDGALETVEGGEEGGDRGALLYPNARGSGKRCMYAVCDTARPPLGPNSPECVELDFIH